MIHDLINMIEEQENQNLTYHAINIKDEEYTNVAYNAVNTV